MKWHPIEERPEDILTDPSAPAYLLYMEAIGEVCLAERMEFDVGWMWMSDESPAFMRLASHWAVVTPPGRIA